MARRSRSPAAISLTCCALLLPAAFGTAAPGSDETLLEPARAAIRIKDYSRAYRVLQPLARAGHAEAQYLLATLGRVGLADQVTPQQVQQWLTQAANQGHAGAAYALALLVAQLPTSNVAEAQVWLAKAAELGHPLAAAAIARGALPLQFVPSLDAATDAARRAAFWQGVQQGDAKIVAPLLDAQGAALAKQVDDFGRSAVAHAAGDDARELVALLLARGGSAARADSFGITPLMLAAEHGDAATVELLLQAGAGVDASDAAGNTALMYAARRSPANLAVVERLLKAGAAPQLVNVQGWSALDWARGADAAEVEGLLRVRGAPARRTASIGSRAPQVPLRRATTPDDLYRGWPDLQVAAARRKTELLDAVLSATAGASSALPASTLYTATVSGSLPALARAFEAGVQPRLPTEPDAIEWAAKHSEPAVLQALLASQAPAANLAASYLLAATRARRPDNVRVLLAAADVNAADTTGQTALMIAAATGQAGILKELLNAGARADLQDERGRSALWHAAAAGDVAAVGALATTGSPLEGADSNGRTPLAIAAAGGHTRVVEALMQAGASIAAASSNGTTPLMLAAGNGHTAVLQLLLDSRAAVDAQNRHGDTALILATRGNQPQAVAALLAAGASTKLRNADRSSALDVATALGLNELAERLGAK